MAISKDNTNIQLVTLGCRLNSYESEVMRSHAQAQGLEHAVIINTCAVTNEAERQSRQAVRRAKKINPKAQIIVTGCSAQLHPDVYAAMPEVDRVLGNQEKMYLQSFSPIPSAKIHVQDIMKAKQTARHLLSGFENKVRAFIEIQNGCNHRCTFCTIPFARGNNRSVPVGEIIQQTRLLVEQGFREIVLTGVDITDYGLDLPIKSNLGKLVKKILKHIPDLPRLRLSSLDPVEMDEDLYKVISQEPRLMPHFHLSLQAGDDMILKRMKRRHLRQDVIAVIQRIRQLRSDAVFGADIIAGFPTETEDMFLNSLNIIQICNITYLHVFAYSQRTGTPAARMPQVPKQIIKERAYLLRSLGHQNIKQFLKSQIGSEVKVLIEHDLKGRSEQFTTVSFKDNRIIKDMIGQIVKVRIDELIDDELKASLLI